MLQSITSVGLSSNASIIYSTFESVMFTLGKIH